MGVGTGPVVLGAGVAALGYALAKGVVSGATLTSVAIVGGGLSVGYLTMIKVLLERMHSSVSHRCRPVHGGPVHGVPTRMIAPVSPWYSGWMAPVFSGTQLR